VKSNQYRIRSRKRSNSLNDYNKNDFIRFYNYFSLSCPNFGSYKLLHLTNKIPKNKLKENLNTLLSENSYLTLRQTIKSQSSISLMKTPNGSVFDLSIYGDDPSDLQELEDILRVNLDFDSCKQKCKNWLNNIF
jgi:hypothetical protein